MKNIFHSQSYIFTVWMTIEALPGVWGNREKKAFILGEERPNFEGNRGSKTILGNREHKNNFLFSWEQEQVNLFQGNIGTGTLTIIKIL